jgi:hypothetical protein
MLIIILNACAISEGMDKNRDKWKPEKSIPSYMADSDQEN